MFKTYDIKKIYFFITEHKNVMTRKVLNPKTFVFWL